MNRTIILKIILYVICLGAGIGSMIASMLISLGIIITDQVCLIEPSPIIYVELVWMILGLILMPYVVRELARRMNKKSVEKNDSENSNN